MRYFHYDRSWLFYWILGRTFQSWGFATRRFSPKNLEPGKTTGQLAGSGFAKQQVPLSLTDDGKMASPKPKVPPVQSAFGVVFGSLSPAKKQIPSREWSHISRIPFKGTFESLMIFPTSRFLVGYVFIRSLEGNIHLPKMSSAADPAFPPIFPQASKT